MRPNGNFLPAFEVTGGVHSRLPLESYVLYGDREPISW